MASKQSKVDHLAALPLFDGFTKRELERIAAAGEEINVGAGQVIVDQGQTGRQAFVIISGTARVQRNGRTISEVGPGSIIGELSLLDHGPRTATVISDTECTLLVLDQRHFRSVLETVPALLVRLLATLSMRIRDLDKEYYG